MRRALACMTVMGLLALAACGPRDEPKVPTPEPSLADRLETMPPEEQLRTMRAIIARDSTDAQSMFLTGNAYYGLAAGTPVDQATLATAYYDSAVTSYGRAVDIDSTMSKAWVNMGLALEGKGDNPKAMNALRTAIFVNPEDVLAHCHLGFLEHQMGNADQAVKLYQRALAIDPNSAQAHYNLGLAFAEAKVFREALAEWETVIRLDPNGELGKTASDNVRIIRQYIEASNQ